MVLFSMHARARVSASVASWFREWFRRQGDEPRALALLLDGQAKDTPGVDELSAAARLAGVDVFLQAEEPETEWESAIEEIHRRAETKSLLLDEVLHQAGLLFREGGINE